jgi:uncharacterized protein (DUF58 family)
VISAGTLLLSDLARVDDLELIASTVVAGLGAGIHASTHRGTSAEFAQYRPYAQGDDPRFVDWKLFARTDRLNVKEFDDETSLRLTLVLDGSGSMDYGSGPLTKFRYAQILAASLAVLASSQRDAVGLAVYGSELSAFMPPRARPGWLHRLLVEIDRQAPAGPTDTGSALSFVGDVLPAAGMVVLISDLLHPVGEVVRHLRSLRGRRHDVLVLQVSDEAERSFPFDRTLVLADAEGPAERLTIPAHVRQAYLENRARHFGEIRAACLSSEIDIDEFVTTEPLDGALRRFLDRRRSALRARSRRNA